MSVLAEDHSGIHDLMRRLGLGRYAIFSGPDWGWSAVYLYGGNQPGCLLVQQIWWRSVRRGPTQDDADPIQQVVGLRREAGRLAERLGCPAAGVFLVRGYFARAYWLQPIADEAERQGVGMAIPHLGRWPVRLTWIEPPIRQFQPPLPPYPDSTRWPVSILPGWWQAQLRAIALTDEQQRKSQARRLAETALAYMKEQPARLLIEGPESLAPAQETLPVLTGPLQRRAGRRYLLWVGFYLAGAGLVGLDQAPALEASVVRFVTGLLDEFDRWSTREQRVILRGLELLARRGVQSALSVDSPVGQMLAEVFPCVVDAGFPGRASGGWEFQWRVKELARTLAECGYLQPETWRHRWQRHEMQAAALQSAYRGLIERLVRKPSLDLWKALAWVSSDLARERQYAFRWHLSANELADDFWALAAGEDALLVDLADAALAALGDSRFPPAPDAVRRLVSLGQDRLASSSLAPGWRDRLARALARLLSALEEAHPAVEGPTAEMTAVG